MKHLLNCLLVLLTLTSFSAVMAQSLPENELAIRTVIECETQAYLNRDAPRQAACWATETGLSQHISLGDGKLVVANGDRPSLCRGLATCFRELPDPDPSTFVHTDYRIRIRGEAAFVTFHQAMYHPARPDSHSEQVRYLEREADGWKIVHTSALYYEPIFDKSLMTKKP